MSVDLAKAKESIDAMNLQERLELFEYLAPKLEIAADGDVELSGKTFLPDLGHAPTSMQVLTEMRNRLDVRLPIENDPDVNWAKLKELGREMDGQGNNSESLMQILTEMRG